MFARTQNRKARHSMKSYLKVTIGALALISLLSVNVSLAANPNPGILPPDSSPYGLTYAEWSVKWWQWVFSMPANNNPILDTADCTVGQSGPVWFLVGEFAPTTITRQCTIPAGKALFFPVYNGWADNTGCPYTEFTVDQLVGFAEGCVDSAAPGTVSCTIDGRPVIGVDPAATSPYRVGGQVFAYTLAQDHNLLADFFGLPCIAGGTTVAPAAEDGVYLMVAPLSAGRHTINITVQGFLDITYDLTVLKAVPMGPAPAPTAD